MKEPKRIPLNPETPKAKKVNCYRLESNTEHLYDDYGYVTTAETKNENSEKSTET